MYLLNLIIHHMHKFGAPINIKPSVIILILLSAICVKIFNIFIFHIVLQVLTNKLALVYSHLAKSVHICYILSPVQFNGTILHPTLIIVS